MITINGQCKRNLPEQVGKNKEDIENLQGKVTELEEKVDTKSVVSGVASGENWSTITINGETKSIPTGGGSEPANYIVDITNSGNTYTAQKHNGSTIQWTTGSGPSQYIKAIDINNNQLTIYNQDDDSTIYEPDFSDQFAAKLDKTKCTLQTTAPVAAISDGGVHIVILSSEPATKYDGYIYLINE